jgi:hypothetical protein
LVDGDTEAGSNPPVGDDALSLLSYRFGYQLLDDASEEGELGTEEEGGPPTVWFPWQYAPSLDLLLPQGAFLRPLVAIRSDTQPGKGSSGTTFPVLPAFRTSVPLGDQAQPSIDPCRVLNDLLDQSTLLLDNLRGLDGAGANGLGALVSAALTATAHSPLYLTHLVTPTEAFPSACTDASLASLLASPASASAFSSLLFADEAEHATLRATSPGEFGRDDQSVPSLGELYRRALVRTLAVCLEVTPSLFVVSNLQHVSVSGPLIVYCLHGLLGVVQVLHGSDRDHVSVLLDQLTGLPAFLFFGV